MSKQFLGLHFSLLEERRIQLWACQSDHILLGDTLDIGLAHPPFSENIQVLLSDLNSGRQQDTAAAFLDLASQDHPRLYVFKTDFSHRVATQFFSFRVL